MYVIVTNHVNWHRENLQSESEGEKKRENTGNLKMAFEWVPCLEIPSQFFPSLLEYQKTAVENLD